MKHYLIPLMAPIPRFKHHFPISVPALVEALQLLQVDSTVQPVLQAPLRGLMLPLTPTAVAVAVAVSVSGHDRGSWKRERETESRSSPQPVWEKSSCTFTLQPKVNCFPRQVRYDANHIRFEVSNVKVASNSTQASFRALIQTRNGKAAS